LNDEVINAHLDLTVKYLRRQANNLGPNDAPKYHAFNSFFYKNLREEGYQKVSRWASRVKIGGSALLNLETVFIPVHEGMHWTLLVVSPRMRTIEYFDSLGGRADSFVANIRLWLQGELGAAYNESEWIFLNTPSPQQDNGSDCGVFLLTSAKAIALGLKPTVYGPRDIGLIRMKIVAELMNNGLHGELDPRGSSGVVQL
jgi:Ulp1 family protease